MKNSKFINWFKNNKAFTLGIVIGIIIGVMVTCLIYIESGILDRAWNNFVYWLSNGSAADWFSAIGTIASVIVSLYLSKKSNRDYEKNEFKQRLPYFNLSHTSFNLCNENKDGKLYFNVLISTITSKLPISNVVFNVYIKFHNKGNDKVPEELFYDDYKEIKDHNHKIIKGHMLPIKKEQKVVIGDSSEYLKLHPETKKLNLEIYRVDIKCKTINGTDIFFTYGDKVEHIHIYDDKKYGSKVYTHGPHDGLDAEKKAKKRKKDFIE